MKVYHKAIILLFMPLILSSCIMMQDLYIGDAEGIDLKDMDVKHIDIVLYVPIENPGMLNLKLRKLEVDLFLNDIEIGRLVNNKKVKIRRRSSELYSFPLEVELKGLFTTTIAVMSLANSDKAKYRLVGDIDIGFLVLRKNFDLDEEGWVDLY